MSLFTFLRFGCMWWWNRKGFREEKRKELQWCTFIYLHKNGWNSYWPIRKEHLEIFSLFSRTLSLSFSHLVRECNFLIQLSVPFLHWESSVVSCFLSNSHYFGLFRMHAPAEIANSIVSSSEQPLGILPHQTRRSLPQFTQLTLFGYSSIHLYSL